MKGANILSDIPIAGKGGKRVGKGRRKPEKVGESGKMSGKVEESGKTLEEVRKR